VVELLIARDFQVVGTDMREIELPGAQFRIVPAAKEPEFLPALAEIAAQEGADLVIPTVTEELPVVAGGWRKLSRIPVVIPPFHGVEIANDKYLTALALQAAGVPAPRFVLPSQVHSPSDVSRLVGWPCLSKPRVSRGGREVTVHALEDWPRVSSLSDRYILQEFAPGADYAPNLFASPDAESKVVVLEKTGLKEGLVGNATSVRRVEAPDVARVALGAAQAAGLCGPLDIDVRRRSDGAPVVLEINARFGANIRYAPEILDRMLLEYWVSA
jgi:carbamoylphosphate synthase large subunit